MNTLNKSKATGSTRRHDLDWLRVFAILLLVLYHVGMFFVPWDFHFKNAELSESLKIPMYLLSSWRMPLLFFISGLGTMYALRKRSTSGYVRERAKRLLLPLAFGIFVIVPPQIYAERLSNGVQFDSYFHFWATVFQGVPYPQGSTSWHHLWFVAYLFVFSLIAIPFFLFLRSQKGQGFLKKMDHFFKQPGTIYLLALPVAFSHVLLQKHWPGFQNFVQDWANFTFYFLLFCFGYFVGLAKKTWASLAGQRKVSLILALVALILLVIDLFVAEERLFNYTTYWSVKAFATWFSVLALLGYGQRYLNFSNPFLKYANEGIYPFYILHQTVQLVVGYHVIQWEMNLWLKFALLVVATVGGSVFIYEFLIRRWNPMRLLFGLRARPKSVETCDQVNIIPANREPTLS